MERAIPSSPSLRLSVRVILTLILGLAWSCSELEAAQFTLTWTDNSTNETGFRIERSTNGTAFTEIATVGANVVSFVDAGLPNSTTYWYRLRAYNAAGNSGYSNLATGTTPPPASNNAPTITDIANRTINAGSNTGSIGFTVGDVETPVGSLAMSGSSNNATLVPTTNIVFGGSGSSRTVTVTPAAGRAGSATITVSVSDGTLTTSDTFVLTVNAVGAGPTISIQPLATTITPGSAMTLSVSAQGSGTITYQWYFNNAAIVGATGPTYTIPVAQRSNAGAYHVQVTAGGVSVTSQAAAVTAGAVASTGRLVNLSSRAEALEGEHLLIPGFVVAGTGSKRVLLRMVGPRLVDFGLDGVLADPKLVVKRQVSGAFVDVATNLDWSDGGAAPTLRQAFVDVGAFGLVEGSGDSALLLNLTPGVYSVFSSGEQTGQTGLSIVEFYDADAAPGGTSLGNISTRGFLGRGDGVMITGFVIEDGPMTLLLRTVGPRLASFGVAGAIADPRMDLTRRVDGVDELLVANDDWSASTDAAYTEQVTRQINAFTLPVGGKDAAAVVTLPAGVYSLVSQGVGSTTGVAIVEVYAVP